MSKYLITAVLLLSTTHLAYAHESRDDAKNIKKSAPHAEQKDWGIASDVKKVSRTIRIAMSDDMRFSPNAIEVKQGETVRFVLVNHGRLMHEMVLGTKKELDEHAALMAKFPEMEHSAPYMAHVAPGSTGEIVWRFNRVGTFAFACLIAGHYESGMVGAINVTSKD
ncbi:MAG TPA: cupredoxin family protein [Burkholderiaceae bacterium]|nr:cupredoxin family protein [Burkholderiaceae bacterium]